MCVTTLPDRRLVALYVFVLTVPSGVGYLTARRSPMTHDCRRGGGIDRGCTLSQISRFNSISSASSASAKSRVGIRERKAVGLSSWRGHVVGTWTKGVGSGRRVKAFHRGVAAASYWMSGERSRIPSMVRRTDAVV